MNKGNIFNDDIVKVLDILDRRFEIGTKPDLTFSDKDQIDEKIHAGIWMSDLERVGLSVENCWDTLSILGPKIKGFQIEKKFKTGYKSEKYEKLASKVDEPPPIFEVLLPKNFCAVSKDIKDNLYKKNKSVGIKNSKIIRIEVKREDEGYKDVTIYINSDYENPKNFKRKNNWGMMYELAKDQAIPFNKTFFDYFNSNKNNPLYAKEGYKVTKILKKEYELIVPHISIELTTPRKISAQKLKNT